jgi:hypothetical protein
MASDITEDIELSELERDIGNPQITPILFKVGSLTVRNRGAGGWLKITFKEHSLEPIGELLPPTEAAMLANWFKTFN